MRSTVILVWSVLFLISTAIFVFVIKKQKRKLLKLDFMLPVIFGFLGLGFGYVFFMGWLSEANQIWLLRLSVLFAGIVLIFILLKRNWVVRDKYHFDRDSFLPEMLFTLSLAFLFSGLFILGATYSLANRSIYVDPSLNFWDLPLFFFMPFFWLKMFDMAGHYPPKMLNGQWIFPLEKISAEHWPWRGLMAVNFEMKRSLLDEHDVFADEAKPWIEAPKEISLGSVFQLCLQERRNNKDLVTIQDLGDEYDGAPRFCWMFLRKWIWYKPSTWKRKMRILDPELSIKANKLDRDDIVVARRIPAHGMDLKRTEDEPDLGEDSNKTVIIRR